MLHVVSPALGNFFAIAYVAYTNRIYSCSQVMSKRQAGNSE
jgi:hypothetical protein